MAAIVKSQQKKLDGKDLFYSVLISIAEREMGLRSVLRRKIRANNDFGTQPLPLSRTITT